jgi:molecular chaperone GrpE
LRDFWQKKGKRVPDKYTNINAGRDEANGAPDPDPSTDNKNAPAEQPVNGAEAAKLLSELDDLRQTLLRRQADFDNYRKRIEKERADDSKRTTARLIEGLIPVIDGFEHALAAHREKEYEVYRKGFELIYRQLLDNITKLGVERVDPIGKQFDPHAHQAMDRLETTDHEDGTIVHVFQPGYMFHGRVLRPAMVRVAVNAAPASNKTVN